MKTKSIFFCLGLCLLTVVGCKSTSENEDSNLPGTWDITKYTGNQYTNGIIDPEEAILMEDMGTITFKENGSGTYSFEDTKNNQHSGSFDWIDKGDKLYMDLIFAADTLTTDNLAVAWDVETNTATDQVWTAEITIVDESDEKTTTRMDYEVILKKK